MSRIVRRSSLLVLGLVVSLAASASAQSEPGMSGLAGFQPRVPVSAFANPMALIDPSRLHFSSSMSFGSGFGGGTNGLQVTSLSYQFSKPAWLEVSVGNAFGGNTTSGSSLFLEGLRFGFRPTANSFFSIQYQNVRSPLQLYRDPFSARGW